MNNKKRHVAQASVEYLLTYGWAMILVLTVVGVLLIIASPPETFSCTGFGSLICQGMGAESEDLILTLQNRTGQDILINPFTGIAFDKRYGYAIIIYRGRQFQFEDTTIEKGAEFELKGFGLGDASEVSITYTETTTGYDRTWTGSLTTPQAEICNNGKDDDGDGAMDCLDTDDCDACEYLDTDIVAVDTTGSIKTVTFGEVRPEGPTGAPIDEDWLITSATVHFYVDSADPGTTGALVYTLEEIESAPPTAIGTGWNSITLPLSSELWEDTPVGDFKLLTKSGSFTITGDPKLTVNLEEP